MPTAKDSAVKETILIVEDDRALREGLAMNLQLQGYRVLTAADGDEGMKKAFDSHPDLIVLDIMLPGWSGLDILAELREKADDVPVLILSARDTTNDKIQGLDVGADDYVTKPFELAELLARVEALLRRRRGHGIETSLQVGDIGIDPVCRRVTRAQEELHMSAKEFDLLLLLARTPGRPLSREVILDRVWGWGFDGTARTVDNFIMSLRQKIEKDPTNPRHLVTVRGVGYRLDP